MFSSFVCYGYQVLLWFVLFHSMNFVLHLLLLDIVLVKCVSLLLRRQFMGSMNRQSDQVYVVLEYTSQSCTFIYDDLFQTYQRVSTAYLRYRFSCSWKRVLFDLQVFKSGVDIGTSIVLVWGWHVLFVRCDVLQCCSLLAVGCCIGSSARMFRPCSVSSA